MARIVTFALISALFIFTPKALGQDNQSACTSEYMQQRVQAIYDAYLHTLTTASSPETALQAIETMRTALGDLTELCSQPAKSNSSEDASPGSGTMDDPYRYGVAGDTGEGFTIQITGYVRPADREIQRANMFNSRPEPGQAYVILDVEVACLETASRCDVSYFDFELTGDTGIIYDHPFVVLDNELETSLFPGGKAQGRLPFLIQSTDSNLRLLYRSNMFSSSLVVFEAEPTADSGLQITATNTVNVRSGPGTDFAAVGSLVGGQTAIALGRNADGSWLKLVNGWVFGELVTANGDVQALPVVPE